MQRANEMRENVHKLRLENRRRLIEEWKWEQENIPSAQDLRERDIALNYRRSMTNPPLTEILSAKALNDILDHLATAQAKGQRGPSVPLDKTTLKQINVKATGDPVAKDAALIAAAQRVEHYEIAGYGTVRTLAKELDYGDAASLLDETLDEESKADSLLTKIATGGMLSSGVNKEAAARR